MSTTTTAPAATTSTAAAPDPEVLAQQGYEDGYVEGWIEASIPMFFDDVVYDYERRIREAEGDDAYAQGFLDGHTDGHNDRMDDAPARVVPTNDEWVDGWLQGSVYGWTKSVTGDEPARIEQPCDDRCEAGMTAGAVAAHGAYSNAQADAIIFQHVPDWAGEVVCPSHYDLLDDMMDQGYGDVLDAELEAGDLLENHLICPPGYTQSSSRIPSEEGPPANLADMEWPQPPETWMILATQRYLEDWSASMNLRDFDAEYTEQGDLTVMGHFWLERDYHPSLGCTEDEIRQIIGATHDPNLTVRSDSIVTMLAEVQSMQVIGYEPGLGYLLTYRRDTIEKFGDGEEAVLGPFTSYVILDPGLGMAFGAFTSCDGSSPGLGFDR